MILETFERLLRGRGRGSIRNSCDVFFTKARNTGQQDICQKIFVVRHISDADGFLNALDINAFISTEGARRHHLPMIIIHPIHPSHPPPFALHYPERHKVTLEELG